MRKQEKPAAGAPRAQRARKPQGTTVPSRAKPLRSDVGALRPRSEPDPRVLLHELQVHQIELELQNDELRTARGELELALSRYTELFDFAPIGYATVQADQTIEDINHAGCQLLGRARSQLRGWRVEQLVPAEHQLGLRNLLLAAEASGVRESSVLELVRAGGSSFPARVSATVLLRAAPKILLAFEDISELKQREDALEYSERALREADRRKDEFLASLSHELRNPLAPIRNSVFVLAHSAPGGEAAQRAQLIIDRQVTHLTRLIDDLLDVTRITCGKIQPQLEQVELGALLRRTLDDQRGSFEALGVALDGQLPSTPVWVQADGARLVQVVSNVLGNALKFTPRGGRVRLRLDCLEEKAMVDVADTGVGIPPDALAHVFEPFSQAPQTLDRARGGLGLGLAMVKGLVELHGGEVNIQSPGTGGGTRVTISLPLGAAGPLESAEHVAAPPASRRTQRVLVIEDNLDASETLQVALSLNGHEVRIAHDGARGLELATEYDPDVVICDIGLPGMDGYEVARAFRAHPRLQDMFLVALSGYARPEDLQRSREAGFNRHLAKPTHLDTLEKLLAEARRGPWPSRENASA